MSKEKDVHFCAIERWIASYQGRTQVYTQTSNESSTKIVRKKSGLFFSGANIIILTGVMKLLKDVPDVLYYINSATFIHL